MKRRVALKRKPEVVLLKEEHFPYLWAAYKRGSLAGLFEDGLDLDAFKERLANGLAALIQAGGEAYALMSPTKSMPVGMAVVRAYEQCVEPHVWWFPEATRRNKLELTLALVVELKRKALILILAQPPDWRFFDHLCKYGALRRVGTIRDAQGDGKHAAVYQSVGH